MSTPRGGAANVNASVANRLAASSGVAGALEALPGGMDRSSSFVGGGGVGGSFRGGTTNGMMSVDEAEARTRAREVLHEFVQQKTRTAELEQALQRSKQETERLQHLLHERRHESVVEQQRLVREVEDTKRSQSEAEQRVEASREEVRKVAQACAQRAADTSAHLRLKEQETQHLEAELLKSRKECRQLRAELARVQTAGSSAEDADRTQRRLVELARKLLDAEREKEKLKDELRDDRRNQQQALRTIESLRRQLAASDQRSADMESTLTKERQTQQIAVEQVHKEMAAQREMYRDVIDRMSMASSSSFSTAAAAATSTTAIEGNAAGGEPAQLEATKDVASKLATMLEQTNDELDAVRRALSDEKARRVEDVAAGQQQLHAVEMELMATTERFNALEAASRAERETLVQLQAVHETVKGDHEGMARRVAQAETSLVSVQGEQQALLQQVRRLEEEGSVRETAERALADVLDRRNALEQQLVAQERDYEHQIQSLKTQLAASLASSRGEKGSTGGVDPAMVLALAAATSPTRRADTGGSPASLAFRQEQWDSERRSLQRDVEESARASRQERDELQRSLNEARSAASAATREKEEWASAFAYSERTRTQLQARIDELEAERHDAAKDHATEGTKVALYESQVRRLEHQLDRESQEVARLRRAVAGLEVDVARRDSEIKGLQLGAATGVPSNTSLTSAMTSPITTVPPRRKDEATSGAAPTAGLSPPPSPARSSVPIPTTSPSSGPPVGRPRSATVPTAAPFPTPR